MTTFAMRYAPALRPLLYGVGMGGGKIELGDDELSVSMGVGFRAVLPLADIRGARDTRPLLFGWGVHGWAARWAVIGSAPGGVRLDLVRTARGTVYGFPVRVRTLWVSLEDPDGLLDALRAPSRP
jgi:hypothetical protein